MVDEGDYHLVVDKPGGLVCHPTKGDDYSSLIGRLRLYYHGHEVEPRFVHRIDRETSGLVLVSKNRTAHRELCRELESAVKSYVAVVEGSLYGEGVIDQPLGKAQGSRVVVKQSVVEGGKPSITEWRSLACRDGFTLLRLVPRTGRMHQLRVHLQWLGYPIAGDKLYGHDESLYLEFTENDWTERHERELPARRQLLSAVKIETSTRTWRCPIPTDIEAFRDWGPLTV